MDILTSFAVWLEETLLPYGGIGLMLLAICDSSFLSLPEVNDILVMTFSIRQPERTLAFAGLTTLGSVIGCSMLYSVGRGGGGAFFRRRAQKSAPSVSMERIRHWYARYGMLAIIVPSLLPPPTPFKIFVLSAGTFGISWPRFLVAVSIGRSVRYFSEGILAAMYGEEAIAFVENNFPIIGVALAVLIVAGVTAGVIWHRRSPEQAG